MFVLGGVGGAVKYVGFPTKLVMSNINPWKRSRFGGHPKSHHPPGGFGDQLDLPVGWVFC